MMDVERLIEEIRKYPVLYDQTNEKYKNAEYKERIWKIIATTIEATGVEDCKKKWASIRDQFRRTIQKRKIVSGQAAMPYRKYKFEDLLDFLVLHISERETISNVPLPKENLEDDETVEEPGNEVNENQIDCVNTSQQSLSSLADSSVGVAKKGRFVRPTSIMRRVHRPEKVQESASTQLISFILSEKYAKKRTIETEKHPVDAFLAGIAPTLKTLDPFLLHEAKSSIFLIVQEFEMKQLQRSQNTIIGHESSVNKPAFYPASTSSQAGDETSD